MQRLSILPALALVAACASTSTTPPQERVVLVDEASGTQIKTVTDSRGLTTSIAAPVDKVFEAVTLSYALLKVPRTTINQSTGEQGNTKFTMSRSFNGRPPSAYLNCGDDPLAGPNADSYPVTASLITRVRPDGVGSTLETRLSGNLYKPNANTGSIYCSSTGSLELKIAEMVAANLKQ